MLRTLIRKQFQELGLIFFYDQKKNRRRSKGGIALYIALMVFVFASVMFAMFGMALMLGDILIPAGQGWLYFAMMGIASILMGVVASVFTTYMGLYCAKDNDLLLSMPIPPGKMLFARMTQVIAVSFLYSAMIWIPALIVYWILAQTTVARVVIPVLLLFVITLFVTVLTCILGWVLALVLDHVRNKTLVTTVLSLAFFALYYYFCFNTNNLLQALVSKVGAIGQAVQGRIFLVYQLGLAADGSVRAMLIFTAIVGALFALCLFVMSRTFLRVITRGRGTAKVVYKEKTAKARSIGATLFWRELKHFVSSTVYFINSGLGLFMMLFACAALIVKAGTLRDLLVMLSAQEGLAGLLSLLPVAILSVVSLLSSTVIITVPSVSLEGRSKWVVQTLPVSSQDVLGAKERLHLVLTSIPALVLTLTLCIVLRTDAASAVLVMLVSFIYIWFSDIAGLAIGIKTAILDWTNETVPVKQNYGVLIIMFGGWIVSVAITAVAFLLRNSIGMKLYLCLVGLVFAVLVVLLKKWVNTKGAEAFEKL